MKQTYFRRLLALGLNISLLASFVVVPSYAAEVPESGIDYGSSFIYMLYTPEPEPVGAPAPWSCFGFNLLRTLPSGSTYGFASSVALSSIGITSTSGLANLTEGGGVNECFQQSGTYYMQFYLQDEAGNASFFPNTENKDIDTYVVDLDFPDIDGSRTNNPGDLKAPDDPDWYKFVVKPATPDGQKSTLEESTGVITANGTDLYTVTLTLRDEFGNVVTQLDDPADVDVSVLTTLGDITIDGIFTNVPDGSDVDENRAYDNTGSEDTFVGGVRLGDIGGSTNSLLSLLAPTGGNIPGLRSVSPGVFEFEVASTVPSMRLQPGFNASDTDTLGAGIFAQPLAFSTDTTVIENDGSPGSGKESLLNNAVTGNFPFYPIASANPDDLPATVSWGDWLNLGTQNVFQAQATAVKYLLLTPFSEYILQKRVPAAGLVPEGRKNLELPFAAGLTGATATESDIGFFPTTGDVTTAQPLNIGLLAQIQYSIGSTIVRHMTGDSSGGCGAFGANFVECFAFNGEASARIVGADIEGAFQGERSEVLVYQLDGVTGDQTSYAGTINNDRLRNGLFRSIDNAVRNPEQEYTGATDFSSITFGPSTGVAVVRGDLILGDDDTNLGEDFNVSGKNTVIVVDGNVYVEDNYWYSNELNDSLGIITYNTSVQRTDGEAPETGNVFIDQDVQHMVGTYYIDGSLISLGTTAFDNRKDNSVTTNALTYDGDKLKQLVLEGVIWSGNTLGGSLIKVEDAFITPWSSVGIADSSKAKLFDLHYARRYAGSTPATGCTPDGNGSGTCDGNSNAFVIRLDNKATYPNTAPPVFRDLPEIAQ